jgi:hypothetical protein
MLDSLGSEVWVVDGGIVAFHGFDYPTRMVTVRLSANRLPDQFSSPRKRAA